MFKTIQNLSPYLLQHPTKRYSFRDTSTIDKIVIHQTDAEDMGAFSPYATANYHVNNNDWAGIGYHYYIIDDENPKFLFRSFKTEKYQKELTQVEITIHQVHL